MEETLPNRLHQIVIETIQAIQWNSLNCDPINVFHYRYRKNKDDDSWETVIHPAIHEVVGGKNDGALVYPKFDISILDISKKFDQILDITFDNSQIYIDGIIDNFIFTLEIMDRPPRKAKVTKNFNWHTKEVVKKA
jgi:hypothetical protein